MFAPLRKMGKLPRLAIASSLTLIALTCLVLVMLSGLRTSTGQIDYLSFAVIDSSKVETKVSTYLYKGLPDAHDFSRYKDFYSFQLWNYCSGNVENGTYKVNFCSQAQQSLYDLFEFWKLWGASVERPGVRFHWLQQGPKLLHVSYIVTGCVMALELLSSIPSLFTRKLYRVTVVLSIAATTAYTITSVLSQVTYGQLISRADDEDIPITAFKATEIVYTVNWVGTVLSLFATASWFHILFSTPVHRARTMDTGMVSSKTSSVQSPIEYQMLRSPVRQRTVKN